MAKSRRAVQAPDELGSLPEEEAQPSPTSNGGFVWNGLKLLCGLALVLGAAGAVAYGAQRFAVTTDRFAIHEFTLEGSSRFSGEQLAMLAEIKRGDNLFAVDLEATERAITDNPWIASAKVSRKLPDTLEFVVEEYKAAALAAIGGGLYLVTRTGHPIVQLGGSGSVDLPVVTGITPEELGADRQRALERIARGVELLRRYKRLPLAKAYSPQEVHMASDGNVSLTIGSRGTVLHLGKGPFVQKMLMGARILGKVQARGEVPSVVFLDNQAHPERVVVRMR